MVHSLHALAGKSSGATEIADLQLAGCVVVAVLSHLGLLETRGVQDILPVLMNVLKLPSSNPAFVQEWCTRFQKRYLTNRYNYQTLDLCPYLI